MISRKIYKIPGSPHPTRCSTKIERSIKMVKISVESFSEEELRKRFNALTRKGDWDKECAACKNTQWRKDKIAVTY